MSAHHQGSGPRSNAYSESRFTNWAEYDPWFLEAGAAIKRFNRRIPVHPSAPKVIRLPCLDGFMQPCTRAQVEARLHAMPPAALHDLRAVFILGGTRKQEHAWRSKLMCYGIYFGGRRCVFLCAHAFDLGQHSLDSI